MGIYIASPTTVRVKNIGAVFMSNYVMTLSSHTKHIDIRRKSVREFVQGGVIVVMFVRTEDNDSDIMTKF